MCWGGRRGREQGVLSVASVTMGITNIQSSASRNVYCLTMYATDLHKRGFSPPQMSTVLLLGNTELGPIMWVA